MSVTQKKSINTINTINTINEIEDISENESEYDNDDISGVLSDPVRIPPQAPRMPSNIPKSRISLHPRYRP